MSAEISGIQRGWLDAVATIAPHVEGLAALLDGSLMELAERDLLDEQHLLAAITDAIRYASGAGGGEIADKLSKRLRRNVYEYLLALDAARDDTRNGGAPRPEVAAPAPPASAGIVPLTDRGAFLIGAEEIAEIARTHAADAVPSAVGVEVGVGGIVRAGADTANGDDGALAEFDAAVANRATTPAEAEEAQPADAPPTPDTEVTDPDTDHSAEPGKRRFGFLRRGAHGDSGDEHHAEPDEIEPDAEAVTSGWEIRASADAPASQTDEATAGVMPTTSGTTEVPVPAEAAASAPIAEATAAPPDEADPYAIAPRRGFHLGDPNSAANAEATAAVPGTANPTGVHFAAADNLAPTAAFDIAEERRKIDERLKKKKCDEAGAMLQQLAQEVGGRQVAELALDAGDRCRALGKRQAATNCYLAASRADPVYEAPWARLADVCIDDQELDLAVSYLERVARLTRLRGDIRGSLRIYRKIVTIAPHREDILEMLMRAETTGRMEP